MGKRLENICETLMELLQKDKRINEEQVHVFFEGTVDDLNEETDETKTVNLDKLTAYLQKEWQYREIESMTSEQAFLCGSIWGAIKLLGLKRERREKTFRLEELKKQYAGNYDFLHAIAVNPGIKHKDLAEKCGKSISLLSQFAAGVKKDGMITCRHIGRETYYYLRPLGEQVYEELKHEKLEKHKLLILQQEELWRDALFGQQNMTELLNTSFEGRLAARIDDFDMITENSNYSKPIRELRITVEDYDESMVRI